MERNECTERTERILCMEAAYDRAHAALSALEEALPHLHTLIRYLDSGAYLCDYEADEAGLLPAGLKRGVLGQDALYDLITRSAALGRQLTHLTEASR